MVQEAMPRRCTRLSDGFVDFGEELKNGGGKDVTKSVETTAEAENKKKVKGPRMSFNEVTARRLGVHGN